MSDNVLLDASLRLISAALDEYVDWHSQAMRHVYYPEYSKDLPVPDMPKALVALKGLLKSEPDMTIGEIDRVFKEADALQDMMTQTLRIEGAGRAFTHAQYAEFSQLYDDMLHRLHRIEGSQYLSGLGYDTVTGLRSGDVVFQELGREMERLARRGRPFSLVLARLDQAGDLRTQLQSAFPELQRHIGAGILYTIRTFDDGYHLPNDEFVITLKHADLQGAQRFVSRLRHHFSQEPFRVEGREIDFTLSFCVAEPVVGEDMGQFLDRMRQDLGGHAEKSAEALIHYEEESPLLRYLREQKSGNTRA